MQYCVDLRSFLSVHISECGEEMVELSSSRGGIFIDIEDTSRRMQGLRRGRCCVRKSVAEKLGRIQSSLERPFRLKIIDTFRPVSAQKEIWGQFFSQIKKDNQGISDSKAGLETDRWVTNPYRITIPPHSTGGTLDLTVVDAKGNELDMGSPVNSMSRKSITMARLSGEQRRNRDMLIGAMSAEGFANYKGEWWHWSYGDWGWASAYGIKTARYGAASQK